MTAAPAARRRRAPNRVAATRPSDTNLGVADRRPTRWLIGIIVSLFDAGFDVTGANLIIGTSAGSTASAQIASASPTEVLAAILATASRQRTGPVGSGGERGPTGSAADHLKRTGAIIAAAEDAARLRRRRLAEAERLGVVEVRYRGHVSAEDQD